MNDIRLPGDDAVVSKEYVCPLCGREALGTSAPRCDECDISMEEKRR